MARNIKGGPKEGIARRRMLKGAAGIAGAALGSGAITGFPTIWAQNNKNITLRQCGTGVSAINEIAEKCKADLGITLQMTALDSDAVVQRAMRHTSPETKRHYQLGMAEQVRNAVDKANKRLYGKPQALHFRDSRTSKKEETQIAVCN